MSRRSRRKLPQEPFEVTITGLSHDGRGVTSVNEKKFFVHGALPGERVMALMTGRKRRFDEGEVTEILEPSPDRVEARCPHFGDCGGCALQHLDPAAQIRQKHQALIDNLRRIGHVKPACELEPLTGPQWHYRRKARLSVRYVYKKERSLVGFRERKGRYVADIAECHVLDERVGSLISPLAEMIDTLAAREELPQIEVACGDRQCALVFRHLKPLIAADIETLREFAEQHDIAVMLQSGGPETVVPLNPDVVSLDFGLPSFNVSLAFEPLDFIQVNARLNEKMIQQALALLQPTAEDRVLDLFCGLGNFTLPLGRLAGQVVGIEGDRRLVEKGQANAVRNGLQNVTFHLADLAADVSTASWLRQTYDKVLVDPPRSGAEAVLPHIAATGARRLLYISCHPASLARDAGILVNEHGFALQSAGVMDMFPHTGHVESMALFER